MCTIIGMTFRAPLCMCNPATNYCVCVCVTYSHLFIFKLKFEINLKYLDYMLCSPYNRSGFKIYVWTGNSSPGIGIESRRRRDLPRPPIPALGAHPGTAYLFPGDKAAGVWLLDHPPSSRFLVRSE